MRDQPAIDREGVWSLVKAIESQRERCAKAQRVAEDAACRENELLIALEAATVGLKPRKHHSVAIRMPDGSGLVFRGTSPVRWEPVEIAE